MQLIIYFLFAITVCVKFTQAETVCHPGIGCFNNDPPFDNINALPESLSQQQVDIELFTKSNLRNGVTVTHSNVKNFKPSPLDPEKPSKFIVHGFGGSGSLDWMHKLKDAFLSQFDINVFLVGWEKGAEMPDYPQASVNLRAVAAEVFEIIRQLEEMGARRSDVHVIGFSLGAHLAGEIGRRSGGTIGRITGLDPADPLFEGEDPAVRLDKTDAVFVDVIHTNGDDVNLFTSGFGAYQPSGDVDFYVNGGKSQPGCTDGLLGALDFLIGKRSFFSGLTASTACSHGRAHDLFLESIVSTCTFTAHSCGSYAMFENGLCDECSKTTCNVMGLNADPSRALGSLYLDTNRRTPYCEG